MWPARACNTLEKTLNISVIALINQVMAPRVGIEPTTNGLTVRCCTAELPGNGRVLRRARILGTGLKIVKEVAVVRTASGRPDVHKPRRSVAAAGRRAATECAR